MLFQYITLYKYIDKFFRQKNVLKSSYFFSYYGDNHDTKKTDNI